MEPNTPETQVFPQGSPTQKYPIQDNANPGVSATPAVSQTPAVSANPADGKPARPKGLNASAIVLGLVALVLAGAVIANETMDLKIDWSGKGPGAIIGIGILLVVLGAVGLARRREDS